MISITKKIYLLLIAISLMSTPLLQCQSEQKNTSSETESYSKTIIKPLVIGFASFVTGAILAAAVTADYYDKRLFTLSLSLESNPFLNLNNHFSKLFLTHKLNIPASQQFSPEEQIKVNLICNLCKKLRNLEKIYELTKSLLAA